MSSCSKTMISGPNTTQTKWRYKVWKRNLTIWDSCSMRREDRISNCNKISLLKEMESLEETWRSTLPKPKWLKNQIKVTTWEKRLTTFSMRSPDWRRKEPKIMMKLIDWRIWVTTEIRSSKIKILVWRELILISKRHKKELMIYRRFLNRKNSS